MFFDPMYFVFAAPAILLAVWAQWRVKSAFAWASEYGNRRNLSGAETARRILDANGLFNVGIDYSQGSLSDHYDPREHVVRLSPDVYEGRTMAAVGVAAHEVGHAIQHAQGYAPLQLRSAIVPLAATGGRLSMVFIMLGMFGMAAMGAGGGIGRWALLIGIGLFALTVIFQIVNLPVVFDASRRARIALAEGGIVSAEELAPISRVLNAAALTYVAATLTAIMTLLYYLWRAGLIGGRRR